MAKKSHTLDFQIPAALAGRPRPAPGTELVIKARDDRGAIAAWVEAHAGRSKATQSSYSKELERLQLWCVHERGIALSLMGVQDCARYREWLKQLGALSTKAWAARWNVPQEAWIMDGAGKRPRGHAEWRPFHRPHATKGRILSDASVEQAERVVRACFRFLRRVGYLRQSVWEGLPTDRAAAVERHLDQRSLNVDEVAELWDIVAGLPDESGYLANMMLVLDIGLCCGLRIAEILSLKVGSIKQTSSGRYYLEFVGKGQATATDTVPIPAPVLRRLLRSLVERDLRLGRDKDALLFPSPRRVGQPMSRAFVHSMLKPLFKQVADRIRLQGTEESTDRANRLEQASAHWLRHTLARTSISDGRPLNHVQRLLRHSSIAVTNRYVVAPDEEVAQTAEASAAALSGGQLVSRRVRT
jgi:site-specific recombinase XerD